MKKTAVSDYGYINAKLRSRISSILTDEFKNALTGAENIEAAVQVLSSYGYAGAAEKWNSTGDIQSIEFELFADHINNYRTVIKNTAGDLRSFVSILIMKPEIENIKSVLRLWYGSRIKNRPVGYRASYVYKERIYEVIDWDSLINAVEFEDIVEIFKSTVYSSVFEAHRDFTPGEGLFELETSLDRLYYSRLNGSFSLLSRKDAGILAEIISTEIDLQNISWLIRYRHFYRLDYERLSRILIPGGHGLQLERLKSGGEDSVFEPLKILKKSYPELSALNISEKHDFSNQAGLFEQLLDDTRKRIFTRILAGYPFSIGIIMVYFFMSERERMYISSVLNGKNYGLASDSIKGFAG